MEYWLVSFSILIIGIIKFLNWEHLASVPVLFQKYLLARIQIFIQAFISLLCHWLETVPASGPILRSSGTMILEAGWKEGLRKHLILLNGSALDSPVIITG